MAATATGAVVAEGYPPIEPVEKLYADNDIRGKAAPHLVVKKWLNGPVPKTHNKGGAHRFLGNLVSQLSQTDTRA